MTAGDLMSREVVTVSPLTEIGATARLFSERRITGAPVVDGQGRVLGVISQTDLTRHQAQLSGGAPWSRPASSQERETTPVIEIMTDRAVTCGEDTPADEVAMIMLERRIHRVVVTAPDGKMLGIVTAMDLLRAMPSSRKGAKEA